MLSRMDQDALRALVGLARREYEQLMLTERLTAEAPVPGVTSPAETTRGQTATQPSGSRPPRKPR